MEATDAEVRLALENVPQAGTSSCKTRQRSKSPLYVSLHHAPSLVEKQSCQNNNHITNEAFLLETCSMHLETNC